MDHAVGISAKNRRLHSSWRATMSANAGFVTSAASSFHGASVARGASRGGCVLTARPARTATWSMMAEEKPKNPLGGLGGKQDGSDVNPNSLRE